MPAKPLRLQRKLVDDWQGLSAEATWATHLDDLRMLSRSLSLGAWQRTLLRELKLLCLFHGRRVVIADSAVNNNPAFQDIFVHDLHGIRSAFATGRLIVALRDTVAGLTELNAQQGPRRADPAMERRAAPFVATFDEFHAANGLLAVEWSLTPGSTGFHSVVQLLIDDPLSPLMPADRSILAEATATALTRDPNGRLLFGNIYDYLVRNKAYPTMHPTVQAVRAAYMLNLSRRLGFAPSVPVLDFDPVYTSFVSTGTCISLPDSLVRDDLIPRVVMTEAALDGLSFDRIPQLQHIGESLQYFNALDEARTSVHEIAFEEKYIHYLLKLDEYLKALNKEARIELVDWQKAMLLSGRGAIDADERTKKGLLAIPPLVFLPSLFVLFGISILPFVGVYTLAYNIISHIISATAQEKKAPINRLLDGTSTLPKPGPKP